MRTHASRFFIALAIVTTCLLWTPKASGQAYQSPATGTPQFGSFTSGPDVINLGNLNVHFEIPLYHKDGRGIPFNYRLVYDSSIWKGEPTNGGTGSWMAVSRNAYGWTFEIAGWESASGRYTGSATQCSADSPNPNGYSSTAVGVVITTPDGATRTFSGTSSNNNCGSSPILTSITASNGGYLLNAQVYGGFYGATLSGTVIDPSGRVFQLNGLSNSLSFGGTQPASDTNGNSITATNYTGPNCATSGTTADPYVDTLGTVPVSISQESVLGDNIAYQPTCAPSTLQYTDANGNPETVTITYTAYYIATNFGMTGMTDSNTVQGYPTTNLVTEVKYPDGTNYQFTYEPTPAGVQGCSSKAPTCTTGRIASITLPTGGTIAYAYTGGSNGIFFDGSTAGFNRTTTDGTTTYSRNNFSSTNGAGTSTTTVTAADSTQSQTVISFLESGYNFYETTRKVYAGSASGGTLWRTFNTCYYSGSASNCTSGTPTLPFSEISVSQKLDNGQTSETVTTYNSNQLPTELDEYDYGASTPSRKTTTTYNIPGGGGNNTALCNNTTGPNICNRPYQTTVMDGSGNQVSQVTYSYDTSSLQTSVPASPPGWKAPPYSARGNLTTVSQWVNTGGTVTTSFQYDTAGQLVNITDPSSNITKIGYDSTYDAFPVTVTPPTPSSGVALSASAVYDYSNTGLLLSLTDANKQGTSFTYDSMLRPSSTTTPDKAVVNSTYVVSSTYTGTSQAGAWLSPGGGASNVDTENFFDGYGRLVRVASANGQSSNPWYVQDTCYDVDGRVSFVSQPYQAANYTGTAVCTNTGDTYTYDGISRLIQVTHADNSSMNYSYAGRAILASDEGNGTQSVTTISQSDGLGRLTYVCELGPTVLSSASGNAAACGLDYATNSPSGYLTTYTYNLANHTTTIAQGAQTRVFTTDSLGRTTSLQEPEVNSGNGQGFTNFSYLYTATGLQVTRTRPAANQTSTATTTAVTQFDQVGRPLSITYNDKLTPNVTYSYDSAGLSTCGSSYNVGRLIAEATQPQKGASSGGQTSDMYCYDQEGRVSLQWKAICTQASCTGNSYTQSYAYDLADNIINATDPASTKYTYSDSPAGELTQVTSSLSGTNYPPNLLSVSGIGPQGPSSVALGNGVSASYRYDTQQRLTGVSLMTGNNPAFFNYNSNLAGNGSLTSSSDSISGSWSYSYDANNRLSTSTENSPTTTGYSYAYDRWGNRWNQTVTAGTGNNAAFTFNTATNQITTSGYAYDAAGERSKDPNHSYTYDAEGRVMQVDGGSTAVYTYDAEGNRVETTTSAGTLDYVYNLDGQVSEVATASTGAALRENAWWGDNKLAFYQGGTTYFVHQTPLGTVRGLTSAAGGVYFYDSMNPFGDGVARYDNADPDTLLFAGLDFDKETNLDHAWARQYSSTEGVWTTPDSFTGSYDPGNPQTFNRYVYTLNSPIVYVDPSGLDLEDPDDGGGSYGGPGYDDFFDQDDYGIGDVDDGLGLGADHNAGYGGDMGGSNLGTFGPQGCPGCGTSGDPQSAPAGPSGNPTPPAPSSQGNANGGGFGGLGGPGGAVYHGPSISSIPIIAHVPGAVGSTCSGTCSAQPFQAPSIIYMGQRGRGGKGERNWTSRPEKPGKGASIDPKTGRWWVRNPHTGEKILKPPGWSPTPAKKQITGGVVLITVQIVIDTFPEWGPWLVLAAF